MKWQEYATRGYHRADYEKMSQWERFKHAYHVTRAERNHCVTIVIVLWPPRCWSIGFDQSQEFNHFFLGPIDVQWC